MSYYYRFCWWPEGHMIECTAKEAEKMRRAGAEIHRY